MMHSIMSPLLHERDGSFNLKFISLIPMLAELAIEFGRFNDEERGGLLIRDNERFNAVQTLCYPYADRDDNINQQLMDEKMLAVLKKLRDKSLLKKEDIREYGLMQIMAHDIGGGGKSFFYRKAISVFHRLRSDGVDDATLP